MKDTQTYECEKCGFIIGISSREEFLKESKNHSKNCDGELGLAKGDCLFVSFDMAFKNPDLDICYVFLEKNNGQKFLHSWNEGKGNLVKDIIIRPKPNVKSEDFVFDFSNKQRIAMPLGQYYNVKGIDKRKVVKETLKSASSKIYDSFKEGFGHFGWLYFV